MSRLLPISIVVICTPLSLLLLFLWIIFAGAILFTGDFQSTLSQAYEAVFVSPNPGLAIYIARQLIGTFGGLIGWVSLVALAFFSQRRWSGIPKWVKIGCFIGVVAALALPAAPGVALPPILLCASLLWLAAKRDA